MQPPSLTFQRQLRKAGPVSLSFVPSSDPSGRDVRIARAHLVLLTDLFLVCAPVEPADEHAASPGADFWLLYPPLAGKHLRVRDGAGAQQAPGEFEVAIMGKERLTFRALDAQGAQGDEQQAREWRAALDEAIRFGTAQGSRQNSAASGSAAAGGAGGEKGLGGYGRRAGGAREAQGWSSASQQQQQASASSSTASSPSTSRPSSSAAPGPSPLPTPPAPSTSSSSHASPSDPPLSSLFSASTVALSSPSATLCFHARNVPAISIEAYLQRILKYCPTTNEVFLALLVYFDRMARIGLEAQRLGLPRDAPAATAAGAGAGGEQQQDAGGAPNPSKLFAIDSFNVHRLVIAGVTVASKFFSDVFYTNSRYAKVRASSPLLALALVLSVEQHD